MYQGHRWKFAIIGTVVAGFLVAWASLGLTLGLDLKGGSELIYQLDGVSDPEVTESVIQVLQKRIDQMGLKELAIRRQGLNGINIQIPGGGQAEKDRIRSIVERSGNLAFKLLVPEDSELVNTRPKRALLIEQIKELKTTGQYQVLSRLLSFRYENPGNPKAEERQETEAYQEVEPFLSPEVWPAIAAEIEKAPEELRQYPFKLARNEEFGYTAIAKTIADELPSGVEANPELIRAAHQYKRWQEQAAGPKDPDAQVQGEVTVGGGEEAQKQPVSIGLTYRELVARYDIGQSIPRRADDAPPETAEQRENRLRNAPYYLLKNHEMLPGEMLSKAYPTRDQAGLPAVGFELTPDGAELFAEITRQHRGQRFAILLDEKVPSAPVIKSPITGGRGIIEGEFSFEEIQDLVVVLKSGSLPVKPQLQYDYSVGPALGKAAIQSGQLALAIGLILVIVFIVFYYRTLGVVADVALVFNLIIIMGVLALFEATLTLPGMAGIILTIGMCIDANILIFERIREELDRGRSIGKAVEEGFAKAFSTILDANLTTLITGIILYWVGTGPIKGFAVTLSIGIAGSFFTALFVTRTILGFAIDKGLVKELSMMTLLSKPDFPFMKIRKKFVMASVVVVALGFLAFTARGDRKYGIDFTGGHLVQIQFDEPVEKNEVVQRLEAYQVDGPEGQKVRPYQYAEVQQVGDLGLEYQIRVQNLAELKVAQADEEEETDADDEAMTATAQAGIVDDKVDAIDRFKLDLRQDSTFGGMLAPEAFTEYEVLEAEVPDGGEGGDPGTNIQQAGRISLVVNLINQSKMPGELAMPEAEAIAQRIDEVLETQGTEVTPVDSPGEYFVSYRVVTGVINRALIGGVERLDPALKLRGFFQEPPDEAPWTGLEISQPFPRQSSIGDSVAFNLKSRAFLAVFFCIIAIIAYVSFRFRFKFGVAAVVALCHDVVVVMGIMAILDFSSPWTGLDVKINLPTIAAFLTIIGYSLNDTIVVFDRIREDLKGKVWGKKRRRKKGEPDDEELVNTSINRTLSRTALTSTTTFMVVLVLALAGVSSIQGFAIALCLGVLIGTYSSIFVASPALLAEDRNLYRVLGGEVVFFILVSVVWAFM